MAGISFLNRGRKIPRTKGEIAKDAGIKAGEKVAVGIVGCVPIAMGVVIIVVVLLVVGIIGVLGHASQDPQYAQETGLDTVFNNTPQEATPTLPPVSTVSPSAGPTPDSVIRPNSCSQILGVCKSSCGDQEELNSAVRCSTGICCVREFTPAGPPSEKDSEIAYWARQLVNVLGIGGNGLFNNLTRPISGRVTIPAQGGFLCTELVIASYKLAGINHPTSNSTCGQVRQWPRLGAGYRILSMNTDVRNINKGDALFWWSYSPIQGKGLFCNGPGLNHYTHHTNLISEITITDQSNGVGYMKTLDANSYRKEFTYSIRNWKISSWPAYSRYGFNGFWIGTRP